jgi:hypothetical protein
MTGFRIMCRGESFANASRMARFMIGGSKSGRFRERGCRDLATGDPRRGGTVVAI